jgi:hypothetical protein
MNNSEGKSSNTDYFLFSFHNINQEDRENIKKWVTVGKNSTYMFQVRQI